MQPYTSYYEITIALASAIDMVNYLLKNHHRRTAILAWHIGQAMGINASQLAELGMAAALHDVGALTVAERNALIQLDVENPEPHAILGAAMLEGLPCFERVANIVRYHHAHYGKSIDGVPIESYILHLADRIEILYMEGQHYLQQSGYILDQLTRMSGTVFHPKAVEAFFSIAHKDVVWLDLEHMTLGHLLDTLLEKREPIPMTETVLERMAITFSKIIDYRSPFTATHSRGVGSVAYALAQLAGIDEGKATRLKISGYLHDIGKIGLANEIIEKNAALTDMEYSEIRAHSYYTHLILSEIPAISDIAKWASAHHEKRDGTGYPYHLANGQLSIETDILSFSDLFTALAETRPYRNAMHKAEVLRIIMTELVTVDNYKLYELLEANYDTLDTLRKQEQSLAQAEYEEVFKTLAAYLR